MNGQGDRLPLASLFRDLNPAIIDAPAQLAVRAAPQLRPTLKSAWPELKLVRSPSALRVAEAIGRGAGLVVQPGILRPPGAVWASVAITASWRQGQPLPGLATRLLAQGHAATLRDRGRAIATAMVAHQLGGPVVAPSPHVESRLSGAIVLAAGPDQAATLNLLLQAHDATRIVLLGGDPRLARRTGITRLDPGAVDAWTIITHAAALHAPSGSTLAVLAGLAGCPVGAEPAADPALLAAAHLILATRYLDPATHAPLTCEAFLDRVMDWQAQRRRMPAIGCFAGISFWKRRRMAAFAGAPVPFASSARSAVAHARAHGGGIAVWPSRAPKGLQEAAAAAGVPVFRIEDGFIRSRGLGADFIPPASVIIDQRGIYYDSRQPSDLEHILATQDFTPALLDQASRLKDLLVARRITKYNLGGVAQAIAFPPGRRRLLVPGQVANDMSVQTGGAGATPGLPLLQAVRAANPDAFILYKPHPDVEAGHRPGAVPDEQALRYADQIIRNADMATLIEAVEEIHTVTSLTGFEALLRGRKVVTYGRPFYAGWGLTTDMNPPARRGRQLRLEELVAATLILYPHYLDPVTQLPCGPEHLVAQLDQAAHWRTGLLVGLRRGQGAFRKNWHRGTARRTAEVA